MKIMGVTILISKMNIFSTVAVLPGKVCGEKPLAWTLES